MNPKLIHAINSGRCYALVGSGPSTEVGYASWKKLATDTYEHLKAMGILTDSPGYEKLLRSGSYPTLLRQAEIDVGGKTALCDFLKGILVPSRPLRGRVYEYLVKWPFACYLTTNFDSEISNRLKQDGTLYQVLGNDMRSLALAARDGASGYVVKLHSDLDNPDSAVLTSQDYTKLYVAPEGKYFRELVAQILRSFSVLIIGHSLRDPDLDYVLQMAKQFSSPDHPVFMIAADLTATQIREYRDQYNIDAMTYANPDDQHRQLAALLASADKFITPRAEHVLTVGHGPTEEETASAATIFVHRSLRRAKRVGDTTAVELLGPLVLRVLAAPHYESPTLELLLETESLKNVLKASPEARDALLSVLGGLQQAGLVEESDARFALTKTGLDAAEGTASMRASMQEKAIGQFVLDLRGAYPGLTKEVGDVCAGILEKTISDVYSRRGLAVANSIFAMQPPTREEKLDIFEAISNSAAPLVEGLLRAAFVDTAFKLVVEPTSSQREYLAALSQGYFLYHWLGVDPRLTTAKQTFIRNALWVCDSSILLPLVAVGCVNHEYAVDFVKRLSQSALHLVTTDKLVREAWEHFSWATRFVRRCATDTPEFLAAALSKGQYKQNLFIDGYIRSFPRGGIGSFDEYLHGVCPQGQTKTAFERHLSKIGFRALKLESLEGFGPRDIEDAVMYAEKIREVRVAAGTIRSPLQVEAEGEVVQMLMGIRGQQYKVPGIAPEPNSAYFVSQSTVLDRIAGVNHVMTFAPGALYRYLISMPGDPPDPSLLHQCMLGEYFDAGAAFVDAKLYRQFFTPLIDSAKHSLNEQLRLHFEEFSADEREHLDAAFRATPDLEKPFFALQVGWQAARRAEARAALAARRADESARRADKAEEVARKAAKTGDVTALKKQRRLIQQEANRLRNLQDVARARKLARQRKSRLRKRKHR